MAQAETVFRHRLLELPLLVLVAVVEVLGVVRVVALVVLAVAVLESETLERKQPLARQIQVVVAVAVEQMVHQTLAAATAVRA